MIKFRYFLPLVLCTAMVGAGWSTIGHAEPFDSWPQSIQPAATNTSPHLPVPQPSAADQTWHLNMIGAQAAYDRGFTGSGVNVMVADSGFDVGNAGLVNKLLLGLRRNFVYKPEQGYDPTDISPLVVVGDEHATHVSGIIAAEKFDNVAAHGVAYGANIIPVRALGGYPEFGYVFFANAEEGELALRYFAGLAGTMVYNASYAPGTNGQSNLSRWAIGHVEAELDAALKVLQAGKIIVAGIGNDRRYNPVAGRNASGLGLLPFLSPAHAAFGVYDDQGRQLDGTALQSLPGQIMTVMSVGSTKRPAPYSDLCGVAASWCVAAPGGDREVGPEIYSTIPNNTYGFKEGTSMAAPMVSGALAVLIEANPSYNAQDLSHLLFSTTEDLGLPGIDDVFGQGLIRLDRATAGPSTLAASSTVIVDAGQTTYWSQLLTTQGDFSKVGAGILTVSGRTNAGGNVFAQLGTLAVDGTLTMDSGKLSVAQPATLAGFGTVVGDSMIAGTLSPGKMANIGDLVVNGSVPAGTVLTGNSVGTLTFNGNVTLTSTATTRIDIDGNLIVPGGPGTYDKIYVTGAGNVFYAAGTLTPVLRGSVGTVSNYTPALGTDFTIVQAQNGASTMGSFSALSQPTAGLPANTRFDLVYDPNALTLVVTPASFSALASNEQLGRNQRSVAGALDSARPAAGVLPSDRAKGLFDALYRLDTEAHYDQALGQLAGSGQPAVSSSSLQAFTGFLGAIGDRQEMIALGGDRGQNGAAQSFALSYAGRNMMNVETSSAMNALAAITPADRVQDGWTSWGQGFGRNVRVGDSSDLSGVKAVSGGFVVGADRWFSNNLVAGGAFGYARTTATSAGTQGWSDSYAGAAYASWMPGAAVVDLRIAAGPSQLSTSRAIMFSPNALQGSANGIGVGTTLEAGYRFTVAPDVIVKPFAGLSWQGFRRDAYSETYLPFGLAYVAQTYEKLSTTVGAAFSARLRTADGTTLMPELKVGWGYDLRDTTLVSQAALLDQPFLVEAAQPGRNAALVSAKMSGWQTETFRLFASYHGEYRSNATSHQVSAGARVNW
ncbi:autotransporter domain-containing protein [Rhodopseudomonas sp. HC1]|nr:autotransporter domain-containing protein [Rhodopseudomonas infernalis]